jgi:hypothetical protein
MLSASARLVLATLAGVALLGPIAGPVSAQAPPGLPSIADKTRGFERLDGLIPMYWDAGQGKLWLEISRIGEELLYVVSLPRGIGSNDNGLDRGQLGGDRIVRCDRSGPRVLLLQPN